MDGDEEPEAEHESSPRAVPALELTFSMRLSQRSSSEHTPSSQVAAGHTKLCSPSLLPDLPQSRSTAKAWLLPFLYICFYHHLFTCSTVQDTARNL